MRNKFDLDELLNTVFVILIVGGYIGLYIGATIGVFYLISSFILCGKIIALSIWIIVSAGIGVWIKDEWNSIY